MSKKSFLLLALMSALALVLMVGPAAAQNKVEITWFVGLGTGTDANQQVPAENKVVDEFNASQDKIHLTINIAADFNTATDTLSTLIAAGTPPDVIGPVGVGGSNRYDWLDLKDLMAKNSYDMSAFDPALSKLYATQNGGYSAIPFAVYPSVVYYNQDLFDEAGLSYPPQKFGDKYKMPDGSEVDWNYDTISQIAKLLTVDAKGNDATSKDFDPTNITQFGLNFNFARIRLIWSDLQPESTYWNPDTKTVTVPESWRKATQWYHDAIWKDYFIPNTTYAASDAFGTGNVFQSGHLGMSIVPLWYTCCLGNSVGKFKWNIGVVPQSYDGQNHVALDADTFRISKGSAHPDEAFNVLSYLLDQAVGELAPTYGALPARKSAQQAYVDAMNTKYNWGVSWQVAIDSLANANPANEHHESNLPNWSKVYDREFTLQTLIEGDSGKDMDVNKELDTFQSDVQAITQEKSS